MGSLLLGGGAGGLGGAAAAHLLVTLANRFGGAQTWLKGPFGPPFFDVAFYMGVLCLGIALGLSRKPKPAALAFLGPFLGMALPLAVLTRTARWGMDPGAPPTFAWVYAVRVIYTFGTWGTLLGLGAMLASGRRALSALAGAAGALLGFAVLEGLFRILPDQAAFYWSPDRLVAPPVELLDGLLTGAGLGVGIWLVARRRVGS